MKPKLLLLCFLLIAGSILFVGGLWLTWDYALSFRHYMDWDAFFEKWEFPLPFFFAWVDSYHHTLVFDIGAGMATVALLLISLSMYMMGSMKVVGIMVSKLNRKKKVNRL